MSKTSSEFEAAAAALAAGGGGGGGSGGGGGGGGMEAAKLRLQVQQLERDKAAITARAEAAEKRHRNLLQEKRVYIGD